MLPQLPSDIRFERRCLFAFALLLILSAWWSIGFHQNDEHFQILEFAGLKLGLTPAADLAWEYHQRIRSWFQPAVALLVTRAWHAMGITDPFDIAVSLRLLSGLLYLVALVRLLRASRAWFRSTLARQTAVAASCFLWFVPYLAVRFSSESWSGSLFFIGFVSLILHAQGSLVSRRELALAGCAMGLAFAARYQSALLIVAAIGWFLWEGKPRGQAVAAVVGGLAFAIAASLLLDRWGYGQWGATPWSYVSVNLFARTAVLRFGASPWWWYAPKIVLIAGAPIGLALLFGAVRTWVTRPGTPLAPVSFAFVGAHSALGHKELRFLFPLLLAAPFLLGLALDDYPEVLGWLLGARGGRVLLGVLAVLSGAAFLVRLLVPARHEIAFQRAIYHHAPQRLLLVGVSDPFRIGGLASHFYRDPRLQVVSLPDATGGPALALLREPALVAFPGRIEIDTSHLRCVELYRSFPPLVEREPIWSRLEWAHPHQWTLARCVAVAGAP
jgi:phosphatidylinositol glycan class B